MDGYGKILLPAAVPTAAGQIGMSGSGAPYTMQFHDGAKVVSLVTAGAGGAFTVSSITAATTAATSTVYLASGTFTVTVPVTAGLQATIKNTGTGTVTVTPASGAIDGGPSAVLGQYASINVVSDGTNVWVT